MVPPIKERSTGSGGGGGEDGGDRGQPDRAHFSPLQ